MSDNIAEVISKVRKLVALSEGNTNENEAKAARAAADRLIQEHRISQAVLEAAGSIHCEPFARKVVREGGRRVAWQEVLLHELCTHYGGAFYFESYRVGGEHSAGAPGSKGVQRYNVLARESDLAVIEYMFTYLSCEVDRRCRWFCGGEGIGKAVAWRLGCAQGIASQFRDMRASLRANVASSHSSALVLLDKRAGEAKTELARHVALRPGAAVSGGRDYAARVAGYAEGRKVQIKSGIAATRPYALLSVPKPKAG